MVRCFDDPTITRPDAVDPLADFEIITTELILKDIETVTKRQAKLTSLIKAAQQKPQEKAALLAEETALHHVIAALNASDLPHIRQIATAHPAIKQLLLSAKPYLIVANIGEDECSPTAQEANSHLQVLRKKFGDDQVIPLSARLEQELSQLPSTEAAEMMALLGLVQSGLKELIAKAFKKLDLITFFTCGPREIHAWPIPRTTTIRAAAGEIHSDLSRGFICAEVYNYADLVASGSEAKLRSDGKLRTEGQEYITQDGDIVLIKFNV